jgi:predicted aminopeptidase
MNKSGVGLGLAGTFLLVGIASGALVGCPKYNVYSQEMSGKAQLAEAQSSRQVKTLEAHATMESAKDLAAAEIIRAQGAARANAILQDSLGGPEGYLRYLQIQAYENSKAQLIYVPTEGGLPVTEASRLTPQQPQK